MNTTIDTWKLDAESLLKELPLSAEERRIARAKADQILDAIAKSHPEAGREKVAGPASVLSAGAPLYVPGVKLHINLSQAAKVALISSVSLVVKAMAMGKAGLVELSQPMTAGVLTAFIDQFTRLTDTQRSILDAICALKRASKLPGYAPTSRVIAQKLDRKPATIDRELKPLVGKVVSFDARTKTWRILF